MTVRVLLVLVVVTVVVVTVLSGCSQANAPVVTL
jgi:hypothetical protein